MKSNLLMTVAIMGLLSTAYGAAGAGDDFLRGEVPQGAAGAGKHVAVIGLPEDVVNPLIDGVGGDGRAFVIEAFANVPYGDRWDVAARAKELFGKGMDGFGRSIVIKVVSSISSPQRAAFIEFVHPLIDGLEGIDRMDVIEAFANVPQGYGGYAAL